MGGTDDPTNLVELTVEEHAEAHRQLYEQFGKREDYLAWQGLLGLKTRREIFSEFGKLGQQARKGTNKGKKYKAPSGPSGTSGMLWFHNPSDPAQKCCVKNADLAPAGWERGQGRKAKNPGLNFHANRLDKPAPKS